MNRSVFEQRQLLVIYGTKPDLRLPLEPIGTPRRYQFRHPIKSGRVTVAGKPSQDLAPGTLGNILRQARLSKEAR